MYFKITKTFLNNFPKDHIISTFAMTEISENMAKKEVIEDVLGERLQSKEDGSLVTLDWFSVCPYCRVEGRFSIGYKKAKPTNCVFCGKGSPIDTFEKNLKNTNVLLTLASKMNLKSEKDSKAVLTEQSLVTLITSLEILMRQTYTLIYDLRHVITGKSVFSDIYPKTRSDFLNLNNASSQIKKISSINLKKEISVARFKFLSRMYSARHIIIHNGSKMDVEFISQTNEKKENLGQSLRLSIPDVRKAISISNEIARKLDTCLRETVIQYQIDKTAIKNKQKREFEQTHTPDLTRHCVLG